TMQHRQSQQAWIISQHLVSPLVQVTQTPSGVISQRHMPIVRLQQQTMTPFMVQQQEHIPPASIVQRFCTMLHATLSSQVQVIFMPPWHFSNLYVQRGTIIQLVPIDTPVGAVAPGAASPGIPIPGTPTPVRSIIIVLDMKPNSFLGPALIAGQCGT